MHILWHMCRSEHSLQGSVLSFYYISPEDELGSSGLVADTFPS